jgi:D-alanyl-D-alanine carboxypeptidase (penicillin-binding protein 5/6)
MGRSRASHYILLFSCVVFQALGVSAQLEPLSYICVEAETGLIVAEENADIKRPPASMLKIMQMLLVDEGVDAGLWTYEQVLTASARAQAMGGTQVFIEAGEAWPLEHLMKAIAVASANDASVVIAEGLWGSVDKCLEAMNARALELGMVDTTFHSVNGLPPDPGEPFDQTTARDMSVLARECVKRAKILEWVREKEFRFRPENSVKYNTNKMLWRMEDCDGLKTGFIRAAGYCVTATVVRDDLRFICVVMGSPGFQERFRVAEECLETAFSRIRRQRLVAQGQEMLNPLQIPNGKQASLRLEAAEDLWVVVPVEQMDQVKLVADVPESHYAPVYAGEELGELRVEWEGEVLHRMALIAPADVDAKGWYLSFKDGVARWEGLDQVVATN